MSQPDFQDAIRRMNERIDRARRGDYTRVEVTHRTEHHMAGRMVEPQVADRRWVLTIHPEERPGTPLAVCTSLEAAQVEGERLVGQALQWYHCAATPNASHPWNRERWVAETEWTESPEDWPPEPVYLSVHLVPAK